MVTTFPVLGVPPYAAPIAAPVRGAAPASFSTPPFVPALVGPYIPPAVRGLPWEGSGRVVAKGSDVPAPVVSGSVMDAALFGDVEEREELPSIDRFLASSSDSAESPWVIEAATTDLTTLARDLSAHEVRRKAPDASAHAYMPSWDHTDFADVARVAAVHAVKAVPGADRTTAPSESAEAAAMTLELLALRVRAGELILPGYDPKAGDAGALIVALAALLGVRLDQPMSP